MPTSGHRRTVAPATACAPRFTLVPTRGCWASRSVSRSKSPCLSQTIALVQAHEPADTWNKERAASHHKEMHALARNLYLHPFAHSLCDPPLSLLLDNLRTPSHTRSMIHHCPCCLITSGPQDLHQVLTLSTGRG